jgi:hypothetical protein
MHVTNDRLDELCRAIATMIQRTPSLEVEARANRNEPGCAARYTSSRGAHAVLDVSTGGVTVTTESALAHPQAGTSATIDRLDVRLDDGFDWDDVSCGSASELARLLVKHMIRRTGQAPPEPVPGTAV